MELTGDPVRGAGPGAASGPRRRPGAADVARTPLSIEATIRGDDPAHPDAVTTVRGQHAVAVTRGEVLDVRLDSARTGGLRRGGRRGRASRLAGLRAGIVVHQRHSAPARARISPPRSLPVAGASAGYPQSRSRAGDGRAVPAGPSPGTRPLPARPASRCSSSRRESSGRSRSDCKLRQNRWVRGWCSPRSPSPTARRGTIRPRWRARCTRCSRQRAAGGRVRPRPTWRLHHDDGPQGPDSNAR